MAHVVVKKFERPDETRPFQRGRAEILQLEEGTVGRGLFEAGWKWSECVKPIAGTDSCEIAHLGIVESGRMHIRMDDGEEAEIGPGDVIMIPPGHDAWVVGDEACVVLDFAGMEHYAEHLAEAARRRDLPADQLSAYE
jgi:uncharacterized cupin superfamily protein